MIFSIKNHFFSIFNFFGLRRFFVKNQKTRLPQLEFINNLFGKKNFTFRDIFIYISFITHLPWGWTLQTSKIRFGSWFTSYRKRYQNCVKKAKISILCNFLLMISTNWPYNYNPIFWRQMFFIMVNTHQKWEELRKMVVGGQKMTKKIDFSKNFDFCDFWFFCVFRCACGCWTFCSLWMYYKKLQKVGCGDEKTILRENGFSPTDIEKVFFWPIFSRRLSPPAVPGNSYGRWGESSVLMLSLKAPKNKKVKIFEFLTPPTWPKTQLIAIQRPKSLKDYFLELRFMAACKNSANSNGGFSRTRRGVFILNTYRSTPYLERRADGAPPPVLT